MSMRSVARPTDLGSCRAGKHGRKHILSGAVAQMVERLLSMQEAGGSMPPSSTFLQTHTNEFLEVDHARFCSILKAL